MQTEGPLVKDPGDIFRFSLLFVGVINCECSGRLEVNLCVPEVWF